ncbi:MAG: type II toxin-antitoxin system RelE/ParE family toxin [Rudanella sp.]|nr:type II toxin-antitoxin system RelE/ParE family toxin [Rudanella sp.]
MAYTLNWTPQANQTLYELTDFVAELWDAETVSTFVDRVYKSIDRLGTHPEIGQIFDAEKGIRSYLIKPYTRLYYVIGDQEIILIAFADTRRSLNK